MADERHHNDGRIDRRKFLGGLGTGVAAGMAGCGGGSTPTPTEADDAGGGGSTETTADDGIPTGGQLTIGTNIAPQTLNPLKYSSVYSGFMVDRIHLFGTTTHPEDQSFQPWAFTDWTVAPGNVGSSEPAIEAPLRDDLTFHDGEDLTPEDYKFSVNYWKEQDPSGSLTAAAHKAVEEVRVDGDTALVFMKEKDQRWFTNILGWPILPKHVWKDVADYSKFTARQEEGGLVGAGAFELADFNWENWYEFEARDDFPITSADYVDWLDDGGPFVDTLRFEIYGSQNAMEQAALNGEIDTGFVAGGFTISNAVKAQQDDSLTVREAQDAGFNHISYNMRRVPFDDREFRQFLNAMMDKTWVVRQPYQEIGAVEGDYVVIPALGQWRPPAPDEIDEYEGIEVPNLDFPGEAGSFNLNEEQIQAAREMLVDNPDTKHDYSFGEAKSDVTTAPDGKELYVNGKHFNKAHTDNAGNGGQGPLQFSFEPPQEDIYQARYGQQFVGALKKVGVPIEPKVTAFNAQIPNIYGQEDFDLFAMGWAVGTNVTYLSSLYSSEGADLTGDQESLVFNPMAYTGADDLIAEDRKLMDFEERIPLVKQIAAKIWYDAPTNVVEVSNVLEPTSDDWAGWKTQLGGTVNGNSFLNVRPAE